MKSLASRLATLALATLAATSLTSCYYYDYCPPAPVAGGYCPPVVVAPRPGVIAQAPVCSPWNAGWVGGGWGSVAWNSAPYGGFCNPYPRYAGGFGGFGGPYYGGGFNRGYCR